jgi:hypothetical protein
VLLSESGIQANFDYREVNLECSQSRFGQNHLSSLYVENIILVEKCGRSRELIPPESGISTVDDSELPRVGHGRPVGLIRRGFSVSLRGNPFLAERYHCASGGHGNPALDEDRTHRQSSCLPMIELSVRLPLISRRHFRKRLRIIQNALHASNVESARFDNIAKINSFHREKLSSLWGEKAKPALLRVGCCWHRSDLTGLLRGGR